MFFVSRARAFCFVLSSISLAAVPAGAQQGPGRGLNPDVSVDGLFSFSQFNRDEPLVFEGGHDPKGTGFTIQQVELTLGAAVDPYFRGDASLVLTPEGIEIEEVYATSLEFPANLQLKAGQFFTGFGRQNAQHPHAWEFVDKPLVLGRVFGGDGLRNPGAQLSWLSPLPWFSELVVSAQNSVGETALSFRPEEDARMRGAADLLSLVRWGNFISLSEDLGLNLGVSYLNGPNDQGGSSRTRILGGDVYLRFRELSDLSYLSFQAEYLKRYYDRESEERLSDWGGYAQVNYRLHGHWNRWLVGLRADRVSATEIGAEGEAAEERTRFSPVVTFYPSEFSKLRLQYNHDRIGEDGPAQQVFTVQWEFLMGAHGAHKF
ncbi:MAG: OprO/OprP family phosphate-selective porin [Oligoflexia bacterium]|nr:OprO/OprP family phosphate-selective porin [Oligoflexia bacterium]